MQGRNKYNVIVANVAGGVQGCAIGDHVSVVSTTVVTGDPKAQQRIVELERELAHVRKVLQEVRTENENVRAQRDDWHEYAKTLAAQNAALAAQIPLR